MSLTGKQQRFVEEYLIDLNATQAAIRAGYSHDTAGAIGHENLQKLEITSALQAAMTARSDRTNITADKVLKELGKLGFSDIRMLFEDDGKLRHVTSLSDDAAACVQSIEVDSTRRKPKDGEGHDEHDAEATIKIRLYDKRAALVDIGKHLGMFTDKIEHSGELKVVSMDGLDERL